VLWRGKTPCALVPVLPVVNPFILSSHAGFPIVKNNFGGKSWFTISTQFFEVFINKRYPPLIKISILLDRHTASGYVFNKSF
jgi:hypothetical protein